MRLNKITPKSIAFGLFCVIAILLCVAIAQQYTAMQQMYSTAQQAPLGNYKGNVDSDKIIVEFMDYRCAFCRNIDPVVQQLLYRDPELKIVYRYLMIFQEISLQEANMALAAAMQDKFSEMHEYLVTQDTPVDKDNIPLIAKTLDLDLDRFNTDMYGAKTGAYHLQTLDITDIMRIDRTPTFLIGKTLYQPDNGIPSVEEMETIIQDVYGN